MPRLKYYPKNKKAAYYILLAAFLNRPGFHILLGYGAFLYLSN